MSTLAVNTIQAKTGSTVSVASGHALDASTGITLPAGHVVQVVHQNADTSGNLVSTTSSSFSTAFQASITPTSSSNKVLCIVTCSIADTRDGDQLAVGHRIMRQIGSGSDTQISSAKTAYSNSEYVSLHLRYINHPAAAEMVQEQTFNILDAPSTTTVCNYKIQHKAGTTCTTGGAYFTLMEITA